MIGYIWRCCLICSLVAVTHSLHEAEACLCDDMNFCNCSSRHLTAIPSTLPRQVRQLDISNNLIQEITDTDLQPYDKLKVLLVNNNDIHSISQNAFQSLVNIEELDISNNKLTSMLPTWFGHLQSLKRLNLLGNQYTSLGETSLFSTLSSLKDLKFGNPYFEAFHGHDFDGLLSLDNLYLNISNLRQYTSGTLRTVKSIGHATLTVNLPLLPNIISDLSLSVIVLEIRNMTFSLNEDVESFVALNDTTAKVLMYKSCLLTDQSAARLIEILHTYRNVTDFVLDDCELRGTGHGAPILKDENSSLSTIVIKNLYIPNFYVFSDLSFVYLIVQKIKSVTCIDSKVFLMPCNFSRSFKMLEYLDLSGNLLTDLLLESTSCFYDGFGAWPSLKTLNVSKNRLLSLPKVAEALVHVPSLTSIDLSQNRFSSSALPLCRWPARLKSLNISNCQIRHISNCIPVTLEQLDVSFNNLEVFIFALPYLKELYISDNRLTKLPADAHLPSLNLLIIQTNRLIDFFQSDLTVRGNQIDKANLPLLMCHKTLVVTLTCIILILLITIVLVLCHYFHVVWYVKMTWAWLKAKRRPLKVLDREILYDAYVSYSERDSEWVENMMLPLLENAEPSFKICFHKRDFVPGKAIIDNIIDAMEKSYKTLFILSEHFVQSEWCKYELEFSHFRLFDEHNDTAILVILEPIERSTVPRRYAKLRKLMNTKTYLKWPTEEEEQVVFWDNLKAALQPEDDLQA
ncbi:PREDICTED: toll-like receptor 2 isoform X2 [Nanorana parkeri]|uniref:toll-like receptor 2 isoform X2 n=1 Tax=Nanorana parkeri TaxID=125878 RepID=UPI0008543BAB|nr:PREDICTED: toll-like receptor 2 isoform X2 [Nanorana parkeri]